MNHEQLCKTLTIERFSTRPRATRTTVWVAEEPVYDDSDLTTAARRRALREAVDDVPDFRRTG